MRTGDYIQIPRNQELRFGGRWGTVKAVGEMYVTVLLNRTLLNPTGKEVVFGRFALEEAMRRASMPSDAQFAAALQPCGK